MLMSHSRLQKSNRTKLIKKKMKFVNEITSDRYEEIDINECRCPSCNKKMEITPHKYKSFLREASCETCDYKGKITTQKRKNGLTYFAWYATPADRNTRNLRDEAHYYFDKVVKERIFTNKETAYKWLVEALLMAETKCYLYHIGYMNSAFCEKTIRLSVDVLYNNRNRLSEHIEVYNKPWSYSKKNVDIMQKLEML